MDGGENMSPKDGSIWDVVNWKVVEERLEVALQKDYTPPDASNDGGDDKNKGVYKVVFVRHGESTWNKENRFTGWHDVSLSDQGVQEAIEAGKLLKEKNFHFDVAYTSVLQRAIKTYYTIADQLDINWVPHHKHWRLNERHYGALQGLNKAETTEKHGEEQVKMWRRSYDILPPQL